VIAENNNNMKIKLLIFLIIGTNTLFAKSNFTVNILINGKIDATRYICINDLQASLKSVSNSSYNGISIERSDLNIKEDYLQTSAIKFNDPIMSSDKFNCYDSTDVKNQFLNCYIRYSNTNDKIFLFNSKDDYQKLISDFINANKAKLKKNYKFTIFVDASVCQKVNIKPLPCPNSIELVDGALMYLERCKNRQGTSFFLFKWKASPEFDITRYKFNLMYKGRTIYTDTFSNSPPNFIKSKGNDIYFFSDEILSFNIPTLLKNNEGIYDAEFQWYVECICAGQNRTVSKISDPFSFLKCPDRKEALPCNE
jgi:hypothetical protein